MDALVLLIQILTINLACLVALVSVLLFVKLRWPAPMLWISKLYASALAPLLALVGVLSILIGVTTNSAFILLVGAYDTLVFVVHIFLVTRPPDSLSGFEKAFGMSRENRLAKELKNYSLTQRTALKLPDVPDPRMDQNVCFASIDGTNRKLLCDLWQPPSMVTPSGLAFIYLHGSAFYMLDKDCGTRPFFRHLAAQGHVIMDVAYRLAPETDMMGMVHDVKRAIVWMKENASAYHVNPNCVALGGGSAGGHLALLAAYTSDDPMFSPEELIGNDVSVCSVISLYGTNDFEALYYHTNQHLTTRSSPGRPKKPVPTKMPDWIIKKMGEDYHRLGFDKGFENAGAVAPLLGGHPDECPEIYARFSPITHVHSQCPPTLLIHGAHDTMAPIKSTRKLYSLLTEAHVPTLLHIFPQTDHAFDLVLPKFSPSAHNAYYDVERFLALQSEALKLGHVAPKRSLSVHNLIA